MLFGLLMWDCLFADVPDTLRTQFQLAPLDLSTSHFYEVSPAWLQDDTSTCFQANHSGSSLRALRLQQMLPTASEVCDVPS